MSSGFAGLQGYEFHEINNWGEVRSLPRVVIRSNGWPFTVKGKALKPHWNGGHWQVQISPHGWRYVHQLVLETFVGPKPSGNHRGLHCDDDPHNNHVSNLYWGTMQDNALDRVRNGNDVNARKTVCDRGHPLQAPNLAPWGHKYNHRICLACNRAKTLARWRGTGHDEAYVQSLADDKYAQIILSKEVVQG